MNVNERRKDLLAILIVVLAPVLVATPQLAGFLRTDPLFSTSSITTDVQPGVLAGRPFSDPNAGFQTEALGARSAMDWLSGNVPWWNPYSGVGLPLAAEYQPASFFPPIFLLLLPGGAVLFHLLLQVASGLGTYLVLRRLSLIRSLAVMGGLLFAFNGTIAWFAHGPASVVPWLPWLVYGIERAWTASLAGRGTGWRTVAIAMALSLLAGFPETAYIDGLFCFAWACVRGFALPTSARMKFCARIVAGGMIGVLLAAPQILSFFEYLPYAHLAGHGDMSHSALPRVSMISSLVLPYAFGPIFAYGDSWHFLRVFWGTIGGYVTIALVSVGIYGFWVKRDRLAWMLLIWVALALGKTFLLEPAVTLWNLVPGIDRTAFARYAQPSWEFALIVLASFGLSHAGETRGRRGQHVAYVIGFGGLLCAVVVLLAHAKDLSSSRGLINSAIGSVVWAALTLSLVLAWLGRVESRTKLAALLVVDAALMGFVPVLSAPRSARLNEPALAFLKANLGLHRFFTLGPIAPNYGAYFGLASINYNYLPVSEPWVQEVKGRFDPEHDDLVVLDGLRPTALNAVRERAAELERLGVRFVIAPAGVNPYAGVPDVKVAYTDAQLAIFELPAPGSYFDVTSGTCSLSVIDRRRMSADCDSAAATLTRRELAFPGWSASVNGSDQPVRAKDLFQELELPKGHSEVAFSYSPPRIEWAWLAMLFAVVALGASWVRSAMRVRSARIAGRSRAGVPVAVAE